MGKPTKRQSRKTYNYDSNRRKAWKKRKKLPAIRCKEIKEAWDRNASVYTNLQEMGLSSDPNKTLKIKKTKELISPMEVDDASSSQKSKKVPSKLHVVQALEAEASIPAAKTNKLSDPEVLYCTYMLDKYGDDYKAMARDPRNHYQETPKQIRKKINMFKNTAEQYEKYLKSKVHDIGKPWRLSCCSPEPEELRGIPPTNQDVRRLRRVTRKYEAARRNGHYSVSPVVTESDIMIKLPVSLSRVRRKLNFGRKPPRNRSDENAFPSELEEYSLKKKLSSSNNKTECGCFGGEIRHLHDSDCMTCQDCLPSVSCRQTSLMPSRLVI